LPVGSRLQVLSAFFTNPILLEFVYGVIIAKRFLGQRVSAPALIAVCTATLIVLVSDPTNRIVVAGLPSCLLVLLAAALSKRRQRPWPVEKFLGVLGDASYSIYLLQVFVISGSIKILIKLDEFPIDLIILITTVATIAAGYISYVCLERPLLQYFGRLRGSRRQLILSAVSKSSGRGHAHQVIRSQQGTDGAAR
jgi:exopolysaccharide production protein ExoZ